MPIDKRGLGGRAQARWKLAACRQSAFLGKNFRRCDGHSAWARVRKDRCCEWPGPRPNKEEYRTPAM